MIKPTPLGNYSCLKVDLTFTRDRHFYFTTVFIPGIILVTSSFITFWLEWNAVPARSMIGNYVCFQNKKNTSTPFYKKYKKNNNNHRFWRTDIFYPLALYLPPLNPLIAFGNN